MARGVSSPHPDTAPPIDLSANYQLVLEGVVWSMIYQGADCELQVLAPVRLRLSVWRYEQHLVALRNSLVLGPTGIRLRVDELVKHVLVANEGVIESYQPLTALILWWISGGAELDLQGADREFRVDGRSITLKPWTEQQRIVALQTSWGVVSDKQANHYFDPITYLHAMIKACAVDLSDSVLNALNAAQSMTLFNKVIQLNLPSKAGVAELLTGSGLPQDQQLSRYVANRTLRLCKALGWTPSQVWATPALEVDRLLALLDQLEPQQTQPTVPSSNRKRSRRTRLADAPDAVLIQIED